MAENEVNEDLLDYEEEETTEVRSFLIVEGLGDPLQFYFFTSFSHRISAKRIFFLSHQPVFISYFEYYIGFIFDNVQSFVNENLFHVYVMVNCLYVV